MEGKSWYPDLEEDISLGGGYWDGCILEGLRDRRDLTVEDVVFEALKRNWFEMEPSARALVQSLREDLAHALPTGTDVVRELFGVMSAQGATGGFIVTSGIFTADAKAFAEGRNIDLIDGQALSLMVERARAARTSEQNGKTSTPVLSPPIVNSKEPLCPRCGGTMVKRIAKQGSNAGGAFWGCTAFPKCRGVISMSLGVPVELLIAIQPYGTISCRDFMRIVRR